MQTLHGSNNNQTQFPAQSGSARYPKSKSSSSSSAVLHLLRHSSYTGTAYSSRTRPRTYPPSCTPASRSASSATPAQQRYPPRPSNPSSPQASHPKSPSASPHAVAQPSPQPSARRQQP